MQRANAELIAKEAKDDLQKAKEKIAEEAEGKTDPQTQGCEHDKSLSTTPSYTVAPQEAVDSQGAIVLAFPGEEPTSLDTPREEKEEEEEDEDCADTDRLCGPNPSPSFTSPPTADIVPSDNNKYVVTYGLIVDDRTRDSTVFDKEREVLLADSSHEDGKGNSEVHDINDNDEDKQVGDHS